jgi:hypothetical protein
MRMHDTHHIRTHTHNNTHTSTHIYLPPSLLSCAPLDRDAVLANFVCLVFLFLLSSPGVAQLWYGVVKCGEVKCSEVKHSEAQCSVVKCSVV